MTASTSSPDASAGDADPAAPIPSHGISLNLPQASPDERPFAVRHVSLPAYQSPLRHHRRTSSRNKQVKETLNAHSHYGSSSDDGSAVHRVNQYIIKQEIGRGSFGSVHLAEDQYGTEFAVKEFSKSRLRKRAQSNLLRGPHQKRPSMHLAAGRSFNSPLHRRSSAEKAPSGNDNPLDLIKEEIAIMKKLNHDNLVSLIEVLDDPEEDSLYMVLEMCKKGVVMKVGLEERADPYDEEVCRCWFRDMILGIEYLHAQGIIHRDIKPDNCLVTQDDVLKIVDFGVSEMFEKSSDMSTNKSAGSPAFMPPELCVAKHGQVSGRAADIWSMGVTLYCLRYGKIPFEKTGMLELYDSIRNDKLQLESEYDQDFEDLMHNLLEKNPEKRIKMKQLREHPWVTKNGSDPLLSEAENCADLIEPPTEIEMNHAITGNMGSLLIVMKAVKRFKTLLHRKRPELMEGIFGRSSRIVAPPHPLRESYEAKPDIRQSRSADNHDRKYLERDLTTEGVHHDLHVSDDIVVSPVAIGPEAAARLGPAQTSTSTPLVPRPMANRIPQELEAAQHPGLQRAEMHRAMTFPREEHARGHAHDPLTDTLFLDIGTGPTPSDPDDTRQAPFVSESPTGVDMNVYEQAYKEEMQRILERRGKSATMYLTRRVEHHEDVREHPNVIGQRQQALSPFRGATAGSGLAGLVARAKANASKDAADTAEDAGSSSQD